VLTLDSKFTHFEFMSDSVREPIQVYLSSAERSELDRAASELGVSRSEVLRRGVEEMAAELPTTATPAPQPAPPLVSPPSHLAVTPPPRKPVAPLREILIGLDEDRADR